MTIEDLALAYELRQEGCCWKRIAQGLGGEAKLICNSVAHLVKYGITKGLDGYARQPGRPAAFTIDQVKKAHDMRERGSSWEGVGRELGLDPERLRKSHQYALTKGLL